MLGGDFASTGDRNYQANGVVFVGDDGGVLPGPDLLWYYSYPWVSVVENDFVYFIKPSVNNSLVAVLTKYNSMSNQEQILQSLNLNLFEAAFPKFYLEKLSNEKFIIAASNLGGGFSVEGNDGILQNMALYYEGQFYAIGQPDQFANAIIDLITVDPVNGTIVVVEIFNRTSNNPVKIIWKCSPPYDQSCWISIGSITQKNNLWKNNTHSAFISSVIFYKTNLIIGGTFTSITNPFGNIVKCSNIISWNTTHFNCLGDGILGPPVGPIVSDIAATEDNLFVCGYQMSVNNLLSLQLTILLLD
jgi:hypothetical protein